MVRDRDDAEITRRSFELFNDRFPYAVVLLDPDLTINWVSAGFSRLLGYPDGHVDGKHVMDLVHVDDIDEVLPMALEVIGDAAAALDRPSAASTVEIPVRVKAHSGDWTPMCLSGRVVDPEGRLLCVIRPAAERRALDLVLEELGKGAAGHSFDAIVELLRAQFNLSSAWMIHDIGGEVVVHGSEWDDTLGDSAALLRLLRDKPTAYVSHDEQRWLIPIPTASPQGLHGLLVMPAVRVGGPSPYDLYVMERTTTLAAVAFGRVETDRILRISATTDYLTGLLNRRAFEERVDALESEIGRFPAGALFVDLDNFKGVNDSWGHEVGDTVLTTVARRIENLTRDGDIVARVGGDEFVVLCHGLGPEELESTRDRLEAAVSQPMALQCETLSVSVSIGVSMARSPDDLATLISRSDQNMYKRKNREDRRRVDCSTTR
ncbi:MAG: GGDEF domain-containing protein [Microthrixaceae bacterium]